MAVYLVKGARNNVLGNIADAGPFEVYLNSYTEDGSTKAGTISAASCSVHAVYDDTDNKLEDITVDGQVYTDVISKDTLNAGIGITSNVSGNSSTIKDLTSSPLSFETSSLVL